MKKENTRLEEKLFTAEESKGWFELPTFTK